MNVGFRGKICYKKNCCLEMEQCKQILKDKEFPYVMQNCQPNTNKRITCA